MILSHQGARWGDGGWFTSVHQGTFCECLEVGDKKRKAGGGHKQQAGKFPAGKWLLIVTETPSGHSQPCRPCCFAWVWGLLGQEPGCYLSSRWHRAGPLTCTSATSSSAVTESHHPAPHGRTGHRTSPGSARDRKPGPQPRPPAPPSRQGISASRFKFGLDRC